MSRNRKDRALQACRCSWGL